MLSPYIFINLTTAVCCTIFLLYLMIAYFSRRNMDNIENKIYKLMLIANMFTVIMYICFYTTDIIAFYNPNIYNICYCFSKLAPIGLMGWFSLLLLYIIYITNESNTNFIEKMKRNKNKIIIGSIIFFIIITILHLMEKSTVLLEAGFEDGLLIVMNVVTQAALIIMIISIIKNYKKTPKKKIRPLLLIFPIHIIALLFGSTGIPIVFVFLMQTTVDHLMYHTIENPDMKLINELTLAKGQAEKSNKAKSDFLSSMSHELRTPLNAIVGLSQMIKLSDDLEEIHGDSDDIIIASQNLLELVNSILDINKLEANEVELIETNYNIKNEFNNLYNMIKIRIDKKPIEFIINYSTDIPEEIYGDKDKIKTIINNLISNAIKYTDQGTIELNISSKSIKDTCELTFIVKDTGRGMTQEQVDMLFTKFYRLDSDKDSDIPGAGLGLAITKSIIELLDGKIDVQSVYGEGSTFTVTIKQKINKLETKEEII